MMKGKFQTDAYLKFLIYGVVIVLINLVGITLFFRVDLTQNKIYSLSDASKKAVARLSEPLTINVFFTENLPAPHNNTKRYLRDILEEYSLYGGNFFNFRFYDVSPEKEGISDKAEENRKIAEDYGIYPVEIRMVEKDELKYKKAYMGMVIIQGDLIEKIPAITSTDGLEYKLTSTIEKLNRKISILASLDKKIDINLFMSSSLRFVAPVIGIDELPQLPETIKNVVDKLNAKNYGQLNFKNIDPATDKDIDTLIKEHNLRVLQWPDIPNRNIKAGRGAIGLNMAFGDKKIDIQLLNVLRIPIIGTQYQLINMDNLEDIVNSSIETLIGINEDVGYLADHGTLALGSPMMSAPSQNNDNLKNFQTLMSQNYTLKQISLADEKIPESLNCLIIAQPTENFTDYELYQIDQALMRGTNLAIFTDAFKEIPQPPQQRFSFNMGPSYQPLHTGLDKLLAHYGVSVKPSFIMDKNCYKQSMPSRSGGGERPIYFAPLVKNEFIDHNLDFMKNIKGLVTINNSPISVDKEILKKNALTAVSLFSSSDKSWEMKGKINLNPMFIQPPNEDDKFASYSLAYLLEGKFSSYFKGKEIPEKKVAKSENIDEEKSDESKKDIENKTKNEKDSDLSKIKTQKALIETGKPGKIFIAGSSALLKDNLLDPDGASPNAAFVLNIMDTLNNRDDIAAMRSKTQQFNPLEDTEALTKTFIKFFNIAGLPVLVVLFGLFVLWRRRSRRKRIRMMFQK